MRATPANRVIMTNDKGNASQIKIVEEYLRRCPATASMVEQGTGIRICHITRHKRELEKAGKLAKLFRSICKRTGYHAWYLSADPLIISSLKKRRP